MSTNFKSGVLDIQITRFSGGAGVGAKLMVSRPCENDNFSASNVWGRLKEDSIRMTLAEAKQIGETLIALSSADTSDRVEMSDGNE